MCVVPRNQGRCAQVAVPCVYFVGRPPPDPPTKYRFVASVVLFVRFDFGAPSWLLLRAIEEVTRHQAKRHNEPALSDRLFWSIASFERSASKLAVLSNCNAECEVTILRRTAILKCSRTKNCFLWGGRQYFPLPTTADNANLIYLRTSIKKKHQPIIRNENRIETISEPFSFTRCLRICHFSTLTPHFLLDQRHLSHQFRGGSGRTCRDEIKSREVDTGRQPGCVEDRTIRRAGHNRSVEQDAYSLTEQIEHG